jgi:hypothetical protein
MKLSNIIRPVITVVARPLNALRDNPIKLASSPHTSLQGLANLYSVGDPELNIRTMNNVARRVTNGQISLSQLVRQAVNGREEVQKLVMGYLLKDQERSRTAVALLRPYLSDKKCYVLNAEEEAYKPYDYYPRREAAKKMLGQIQGKYPELIAEFDRLH